MSKRKLDGVIKPLELIQLTQPKVKDLFAR